jgi:hypothetical protein
VEQTVAADRERLGAACGRQSRNIVIDIRANVRRKSDPGTISGTSVDINPASRAITWNSGSSTVSPTPQPRESHS